MTTGIELVWGAGTFLGQPYSTDPGRTDPNSGHKDCSGLIAATFELMTGSELGQYVSVTIFDMCAKAGLEISVDKARGIAGACLLMPEDPLQGWGPKGHIGFSTGDGFTIEATPPRVQRLSNTYQPWGTRACLLPGIDYSNSGHGSQEGNDLTSDEQNMLIYAYNVAAHLAGQPVADFPRDVDLNRGPLGFLGGVIADLAEKIDALTEKVDALGE